MSFINFVVDASKNPKIGTEAYELITKGDRDGLDQWFKKNGYTVSAAEIETLLNNKESLLSVENVKAY